MNIIEDQFSASNFLIEQRPFGSWSAIIVENNNYFEKIDHLFSQNIYGINLITDSSSLSENLEFIIKNNISGEYDPIVGKLHHMVRKTYANLKLVSSDTLTKLKGNISHEELLFVLSDLINFFSFEFENFSSIIGNILGIGSFLRSSLSRIGLHSSTLYDTKLGVIHLILGQTTSGKSSCAYLLEQISNKRLIVLGDDWSEIYVDEKLVRPFTYLLGEPRNVDAKRYLLESRDFEKVKLGTNKTWYIKKNYPEIRVGKIGYIFQLDVNSRVKNQSYILRKNNSNIPFMNINFHRDFSSQRKKVEKENTQRIVKEKIENILITYDHISEWENYFVVDAGSGNMDLVAKKIFKIIDIM